MEATAGVAAVGPMGEARPRPGAAKFARRTRVPEHAVTVKHDEITPHGSPVFVRLDVQAETYADAEEELRVVYSLAKSQLAALQLAEQILAGKAVDQ